MVREEDEAQHGAPRPLLAAVVVVLLTALAMTGIERMMAGALATAERTAVADRAATLRAQLEKAVNHNVLLLRGMAAFIASRPDLDAQEFAGLARDLVSQGRHIRSMTYARGTVVTYAYPSAGTEPVIGLDLARKLDQRDAVLRAVAVRDVVVAGPVELVEGGEAFIGRMPVHRSAAGADGRSGAFVGIVSLPLDAAGIYREAGLTGPAHGLTVALRGRDALGAAGEVFFGDSAVFEAAPVTMDVALAGEGGWQMAAVPTGGWGGSGRAGLWTVRGLAACLVAAAGALAWFAAARAAERRAVEADLRRTATVDLATGAGNRRHFSAAGAAEIARSRRFGHVFSVLVLRLEDIDRLEAGGGAGAAAAVLRAVAAFGRREMRAIDTLARIDEDTFAVLLPETSAATAAVVGRRIRNHFDLVGVRWRDRTLTPRFAVAATAVRQEDAGIEDVLARALSHLARPRPPAADAA